MKSVRIVLLLLVAFLAACSSTTAPTPTTVAVAPTELPTATLPPTATPTAEPSATPTAMPTNTATPEPTATPTETPTPTPVPVVSARVTDLQTGQPISGAEVVISNATIGVTFARETDADGNVRFEVDQGAVYALEVHAAGYKALSQSDVTLDGMVELALTLEPQILAEVSTDGAALRSGPGSVYGWLDATEMGNQFEVIGRNEDGTWLQIDRGEEEGGSAWIFAENVTITGSVDAVDAVEPPPTPTPAPVVPTATPEPPEYITLFYVSDPNEVLGVFPVRSFDANSLFDNMVRLRNGLYTMRNNLDGAAAGDAAACNSYVAAYDAIRNAGVFYEDVPSDWENIDFAYFLSFVYSLDRTRPAYLSCVNAGQVDQFNRGLASQTIDQVLNLLLPTLDEAGAKLGRTP